MAPFTQWLPARSDQTSDLVLSVVAERAAGLKAAGTALEHALVVEGFELLAEKGDLQRVNGQPSLSTLRLRVSTAPLSSIGHGCDVLAFLTEDVDHLRSFGLGRGSVLLGETRTLAKLPPEAIPAGVITYPVPFTDLGSLFGKGFSERSMMTIGVLTELLRVPWETVRSQVTCGLRRRCFDVGVAYAKENLAKRDVFALSMPGVARRHVLLDAHQAVLLGLGMATCESGASSLNGLDNSPEEWVAERVRAARQLVSLLKARGIPGVMVYRGPQGRFMVMVGTADPTLVRAEQPNSSPRILVAGDLVDTVRLVGVAQRLVSACDDPVWVMVDQGLAHRRQSVPIQRLEEVAEEMREGDRRGAASPCSLLPLSAERDGGPGADIGYVTWGAAQGVVREAIGLCRGFRMNVAALYPKALSPVPIEELESFAASVKHLVVVEPNRARQYTTLVKAWTNLEPSTLMPMPGHGLTPMDIFLREGLGV